MYTENRETRMATLPPPSADAKRVRSTSRAERCSTARDLAIGRTGDTRGFRGRPGPLPRRNVST